MHKTSKSSRTFQASDLWICPSYSAKWCNKTSILTSTDSQTVFVIFYSLCHLETFFPRPHSVMVLFTWPSTKETGLSLLGANPNSNTNVLTHLESNGGVIMRKEKLIFPSCLLLRKNTEEERLSEHMFFLQARTGSAFPSSWKRLAEQGSHCRAIGDKGVSRRETHRKFKFLFHQNEFKDKGKLCLFNKT